MIANYLTALRGRYVGIATFAMALLSRTAALAQNTNLPPVQSSVPDVGFSVLRLVSALIFVLALFLGGAWLFKNWQRLALSKKGPPKLNVLEAKSLGSRHALYLVGYEQQRFLVGSSPAGINLLSHLPEAGAGEITEEKPSFAHNLQERISRGIRQETAR